MQRRQNEIPFHIYNLIKRRYLTWAVALADAGQLVLVPLGTILGGILALFCITEDAALSIQQFLRHTPAEESLER